MQTKTFIAGCVLLFFFHAGYAQQESPPAPIPVEVFANDAGIQYQLVFNKPLFPKGKWYFFNLSNYFGGYHNEPAKNQFVTQTLISYDLWKGLGVAAGASMISFSGFRPTAGLRYAYTTPDWVFILLTRFDLTETHNFELFTLISRTVPISNRWRIYTRVQGLYNYNIDQDFHGRSYLNFRAGPAYKNVQFGIGVNIDAYGPTKKQEEHYGAFVCMLLF